MYQEDAERHEHERQLVANEQERRQGTGMVDLKRDDWEPEDEDGNALSTGRRELVREEQTPEGAPIRAYKHPHAGFQVYVGGWLVATRATRAATDGVVDRYAKPMRVRERRFYGR